MATENATSMLPYVAFSAFTAFLDALKNHSGVPQQIDRELMDGMSGATQSHLNSALKSLGLIKTTGQKTDRLDALVVAYGTDDWHETFGTLIKETYADVVADLDIESASLNALRKRFKESGLDGSMLDRCVRFYINALKEAKTSFSPLFTKRRRRGTASKGNGRNDARNRQTATSTPTKTQRESPGREETEEEFVDLVIPGGVGSIRVREDLTMDDYPLAEAIFNAVKVMAERNSARHD